MARRGVRHLLVCDERKLVGVVSERSLFALQRQSMREVVAAIEVAHDLEGLQRAAAEIRALARGMLAQGVSAEPLTQLIATLNDRLAERILALEAARHDLGGVRFCWLALGSEGRHEQTFASDQDNAIVFEADGPADAARARLLPFANAVNAALDACGFPLCKGDIMARNPSWCLAAAEWRMRFGEWIRNPHPEALLNANIFFDFRPLWGEAALASDLRAWLERATRDDQRFLRMMAQNALESRPPLGFFGDVQTERGGRPGGDDRPQGAGHAHLHRRRPDLRARDRRGRAEHRGAAAARRCGAQGAGGGDRGGGRRVLFPRAAAAAPRTPRFAGRSAPAAHRSADAERARPAHP